MKDAKQLKRILNELYAEGHKLSRDVLALLSPYGTDHLNWFGAYFLDKDRLPLPLDFNIPDWAKEFEELSA